MPQKNRESMKIVSVHLPPSVISLIDSLVENGIYPNRSEFIRAAVVEKLATVGALSISERAPAHSTEGEGAEEDIDVVIPQFMPELKIHEMKEMRTGDAVYALMPPCYIQSSALLDLIRNTLSQNPAKALYAALRRHRGDIDIISVGDLVFYRRLDAVGDWRANALCREYSLEAYLHAITRGIMHLLSSVRTQRVCVRMRTLAQAVAASVRDMNDALPHAIIANPAVRISLARFTAKLLGVYDGEMTSKHAVIICLKKP